MRIGPQGHESDGGNNREKDLRSQPDDEREIKKSAKESFHAESILSGQRPIRTSQKNKSRSMSGISVYRKTNQCSS
jgi:hypothetical protein